MVKAWGMLPGKYLSEENPGVFIAMQCGSGEPNWLYVNVLGGRVSRRGRALYV